MDKQKTGRNSKLSSIGRSRIQTQAKSRLDQIGKKSRLDQIGKREKDPLSGLAVTGNIETDDKVEIQAVKGFLAQTRIELEEATNMRYSVTLVFPSNAQADEFLRQTGWGQFTDSTGAYYDGVAISDQLGLHLQPVKLPFRKTVADRRLVEEVGIQEE